MNDLSAAMQNVDRAEANGGAGSPLIETRARPKIAVVPATEAQVATPDPINALAAASVSRGLRAATLRGMAATAVSLAKEAGGQDPRHFTPFDQLTAENIGALLTAVMDAVSVELPAGFRQASAAADLDRANGVAKALSAIVDGA